MPFTATGIREKRLSGELPAVELGSFNGPLDLLLHLVRLGRMDIFDLPMTSLCEQYLLHLAAMEAMDLNIAGEFFVMAATLIEIKSRMLLPPLPSAEPGESDGEEALPAGNDPRAELVERLLAYNRFQTIAETLRQAEADRRALFFRPPSEYGGEYRFPPRFGTLSASDLLRTLERVLERVGAGERSVTAVRRQKVTLRIKMAEVRTRAEKAGGGGIELEWLLPDPPFLLNEVVLLFLALLELLKIGVVEVTQDDFCGTIRVFYVPETQRIERANG
ncbi:MAG: segregation/condensation protein A [Capsulimonadales bacterium]|nr:segregation/condensation protein A [Capsulimonadales bacterium]